MFYGLSRYFKNLLPKQLFYRGLLIVALPIIILQVTISVVFFDSLWIKTNIGMTRALVGEIKTFIDSYNRDNSDKNFIENTFEEYLEINVRNDDQLVKMAGIVQRLISAEGKGSSEDEYGLTDEEKQQLLSGIEDTIKDIQIESDNIHNKIENKIKAD